MKLTCMTVSNPLIYTILKIQYDVTIQYDKTRENSRGKFKSASKKKTTLMFNQFVFPIISLFQSCFQMAPAYEIMWTEDSQDQRLHTVSRVFEILFSMFNKCSINFVLFLSL